MNNNQCQQCKDGYKADGNGVCQLNDINCVTSNNGRCQQCKQGYYIDVNGKCKSLPANCVTANMQTGDCL